MTALRRTFVAIAASTMVSCFNPHEGDDTTTHAENTGITNIESTTTKGTAGAHGTNNLDEVVDGSGIDGPLDHVMTSFAGSGSEDEDIDTDAPTARCVAGEEQTIACGACGYAVQVCSPAGDWDEPEACTGEHVCAPGEVEQGEPCGRCGVRTRYCLKDCSWGPWHCGSEGDCTPGNEE